MANRSSWVTIGWVTAVVFVAVGVIVTVIGLLTPVSYGWFAYQPLADATFTPGDGGVHLSRTTAIGLTALMLGLIALAFLAGRRLAERQRR